MAEEDHVDLNVKYDDWVAIKRMTVDRTTKPQNIAFHLAGIRKSTEGRFYRVLGIKTEVLDSFSSNVTKPLKKKKPESLKSAIAALSTADGKKAISESVSDKSLESTATSYLVTKLATDLGYFTSVDQIAISKMYPELKPKKVPGMKKMMKGD